MKDFWDQSWDHVSMDRVNAYIRDTGETGMSSDPIIDYLKGQHAKVVCDAGCGCGAYSLALALHGFTVFGFDISHTAVNITKELLSSRDIEYGAFRACNILATGYDDGQFDAVVCRDVLDHMPLAEGAAAFQELCRIVKKGGPVILTLDQSDAEYEAEPHTVDPDGNYLFTAGRWNGMVFHPYSANDLADLIPVGTITHLGPAVNGYQIAVIK